MGDVVPEEGGRDGQPDDVVPPHDHQGAEPLQRLADDDRIDGDRDDGRQDQRVAEGFAAVHEQRPLPEQQDCGADERTDDPRLPHAQVAVRMDQVVGNEREDGAERGNDRGVDRRRVRRTPQQQVHPSVDHEQRDGHDPHDVVPRDAPGAPRKEGEGDEEERRGEHLQHEYLLEIQVVTRQRDIEREVRSEKQVREDQVEMIACFPHELLRPQFLLQTPRRHPAGGDRAAKFRAGMLFASDFSYLCRVKHSSRTPWTREN